MSKDGKDAELMKLTEEDCSLIRDALITMLEQLYRAKSEMPIITEEFRALFEKQDSESSDRSENERRVGKSGKGLIQALLYFQKESVIEEDIRKTGKS